MSEEVLVKVDNVSKRFCRSLKRSLWYGLQDLSSELGGRRHGGGTGLPRSTGDVELRRDEFWAVKDVSFELRRGECLGLIGRNGAGKTTLLKMLNGLVKPDAGKIQIYGRVSALIALGAGFNPLLTGRENVYTNASILGLSKAQIDSKIDEIIEFAEIRDFIDSPVQTYSSGMQVRLGFSVAISLKPDIILLDEVLAVGDIRFRNKCYNILADMRDQGVSFILVTHDMAAVNRICSKAVYIDKGSVKAAGETGEVIREYEIDSMISNHPSIVAQTYHKNKGVNMIYLGLKCSGMPAPTLKTLMPGEIQFEITNVRPSKHLSVSYMFSGITSAGANLYISSDCNPPLVESPDPHSTSWLISLATDQVTLPPGNYTLKVGVWTNSFKQIAAAEAIPISVELGSKILGESTHVQHLDPIFSFHDPNS